MKTWMKQLSHVATASCCALLMMQGAFAATAAATTSAAPAAASSTDYNYPNNMYPGNGRVNTVATVIVDTDKKPDVSQPTAKDPYPPVKFDLPGHEDFVKSLNLDPARHQGPQTYEEKKLAVQDVFHEKSDFHAQTKHFEKGVTCITCHDQQRAGTPDWMASVTAPAMKRQCGSCHVVQAKVHQRTDTHAKIDCIGCHMPNMPMLKDYKGEPGKDGLYYDAVRRAHLYKINTDPKAHTFVKDSKGNWQLAKNDKGRPFVDLMWSCGRATPADYTLSGEAQGCHSPKTSTLDPGLQYKDRAAIAAEVERIQKPVKEGYQKLTEALERQKLLLVATKMSFEDRTDVHMLLDKAQDVADEVKKDGSWGMHAPRYLLDRIETALGYVARAQSILDKGGYDTKAVQTEEKPVKGS